MGYWTKLQSRLQVKDRHTHPWAVLLLTATQRATPELVETLKENGDLDAYLSMHVDDIEKRIRQLRADGTDYETAKEIAFEEFFPSEPDEIEDWEEEGGQQDAIDALSDWVGRNATSDSDMED